MRGIDKHWASLCFCLSGFLYKLELCQHMFSFFFFGPKRGKETNVSLTMNAIVASSCFTFLIFFFKSLVRDSDDENVCVTTFANFCWLSRIFKRAWFWAIEFSACQFKVASVDETFFRVPSELIPTGVLIFQTCHVLAWGWLKFSSGGKYWS